MYIIRATRPDSPILHFGPFKSTERAEEYATTIDRSYAIEIYPIIVPFNP